MEKGWTDRNPLKRITIDPTRGWELRYWGRQFGCSDDELLEAIAEAGTSVAAVKSKLEARKPH